MNKLAQYLNQHIVGEVTDDQVVITAHSTDRGVLQIKPEMVAYPFNTNDLRKLARFSWQLANKGHKLPVTIRGGGTKANGSSLGSGISTVVTTHMNKIFEYDMKQRLVRLQPGVKVGELLNALRLQNATVPALESVSKAATIGGALASQPQIASYEDWVDQLEVVLANGDVMQTKRLSKRELNRKKGEEGFEAELYRAIDTMIEENAELIESVNSQNAAGYQGIKSVKRKDGSFDLAPLFLGSSGTLGFISELIIKVETLSPSQQIVVGIFDSASKARDCLDLIEKISPYSVEYYDGTIIQNFLTSGKELPELDKSWQAAALIVAKLKETSDRVANKKIKKMTKLFNEFEAKVSSSVDYDDSELALFHCLSTVGSAPSSSEASSLPIFEGVYVPLERFEQFQLGLDRLSASKRLSLPLFGKPFEEIWYVRPVLNLRAVGGKQAVISLIDEMTELVTSCGGFISSETSDGQLHAGSSLNAMSEDERQLNYDIKAIFDPSNVLGAGTKQFSTSAVLFRQMRQDPPLVEPNTLLNL